MRKTEVAYSNKVYLGTGHEGPEGEQRCSSTLSLISALDEVGGQGHAPAALRLPLLGRDSYQEISTLVRISPMGWMSGYWTPNGSYFIWQEHSQWEKNRFCLEAFVTGWTGPYPFQQCSSFFIKTQENRENYCQKCRIRYFVTYCPNWNALAGLLNFTPL
jgi:hypothetical protein